MNDLQGLTAIVTGAASGIGAATAREFSARGARVIGFDLVASPDPAVRSVLVDLTDAAAVERAVDDAVADGLDLLVNNAGIGVAGDVSTHDDATWHRVFDVNVLSAVRTTRSALPRLRRSPAASIVNTCSLASTGGLQDRALYSATKGALAALTRSMAADLLDDGVRVNAVAPSTVDTPLVRRSLSAVADREGDASAPVGVGPLGRLVTAEEVAFAIAYLASPRAGSTNGVLLPVDGGATRLLPRPRLIGHD